MKYAQKITQLYNQAYKIEPNNPRVAFGKVEWDLGTAKNNTAAGNFAREMISIVINMKQLAALGVGVGGGLGYMLSDDDNKLMGTAIGITGGLLARPAVMKALQKRKAML